MAKPIFSTLAILLSLPASFWAADFRNWNEHTGQAGLIFIEAFQGTRQQALGNAGGSVFTTDPFQVLTNPAAVDSAPFRHHFAMAGETGALDRDLGLLAWNFSLRGTLLQATFAFTQNDPITGLDEQAQATGREYRVFSQVSQISAMHSFRHVRLGASAKFIQDHLSDDPGDQDAVGAALDWGLVWNSPSPRYGAGISVLNLGRQFRAYTEKGVDDLSLNTRVRASSHYRPSALRGLTVLLDADLPRYTPPLVHWGLEYQPNAWIMLRGGLERSMASVGNTAGELLTGEESSNPPDAGLSYGACGFGLRWSRYSLDYAMVFYRHEIGQAHKLGLRTGF